MCVCVCVCVCGEMDAMELRELQFQHVSPFNFSRCILAAIVTPLDTCECVPKSTHTHVSLCALYTSRYIVLASNSSFHLALTVGSSVDLNVCERSMHSWKITISTRWLTLTAILRMSFWTG